MKRNLCIALIAALAAAPAFAGAQGISHTYVEARGNYAQIDAGTSDVTANANGFGIAGSYEIADTGIYAFGSFDNFENDALNIVFEDADVDLDRTTLGLGYAIGFTEKTDILVEAAAVRIKASAFDGSVKEDGWKALVGARTLATPELEFTAKAGVIRVENDEVLFYDGALVELGARYHFDNVWSAGLETNFTKDERNASLSVRASF